jgi:hypothetical protein
MRELQRYIDRYGPEAGPKLFHVLQSQAGHASVSARLRRKIAALRGSSSLPSPRPLKPAPAEVLPLFPHPQPVGGESSA